MDAGLTISDLAEQAGLTVRTLRDYNERGLLPPPKMKGRTGFYGEEHLNRVRIVERLLERGITLNGVRGLLEAWDRGEDLADVLGVAATTTTPPARQETAGDGLVTAIALAERFHEIPDGLARAVMAGLYEPVDPNTYRATDPELVELFDELIEAGMPITRALDEVEQLRTDCDHIARQFTDIFLRTTIRSFRRSDRGERDVGELTAQLTAARARPGRVAAGVIDRFVERYLGSVVGRELADVFPDGA